MNNLKNTLLPAFEPLTWLYLAGFIYLSCLLISTWLITQQPYLGLSLTMTEDSERVQVSAIKTASAKQLKVGDQLLTLSVQGHSKQLLNALSIMEEPDNFQTYAEYNRFIKHQQDLYTILAQKKVTLTLVNGTSIELPVAQSRPVSHLPYQYWLLLIVAGAGYFVGLWIWVFRRGQISARLIALSGFGFMLGACCLAIYTNRELVIDPTQFIIIANINHLGNILFVTASLTLLCYYPSKIADAPFALIIFSVMFLVWLNELLQWYQVPIHTFYLLPYFVTSILGFIAGRQQWLKHKNNPVAKASIRWFLLTMALSISCTLVLYFIPTLFNEPPLLPVWAAQIMVLMIYMGLVLGVIQYRLFDVERWWFNSWIWFFSGCGVIAVELLLVSLFNISHLQSTAIAIVFIAWCYFPLRQWLWSKTIHPHRHQIENFFPLLTEAYISSPSVSHFKTSWPDLLAAIYQPLSIKVLDGHKDAITLTDQGLSILLPALNDQQYIKLSGFEKGRKLFGQQDVHFIESALIYARNCISWKNVREEGVSQERERIRRDLHDDVGALLLTLVHKAESAENAQLAREALKGVRDSIYSLRTDHYTSLDAAFCTWRVEIKQRTDAAHVNLHWQIGEVPDNYYLNPRQRINLERILRELITNILKHAQPQTIHIGIAENKNKLQIIITDDGNSDDSSQWQAHTGLYSIQTRAQEIRATLSWTSLNDSTAFASGTMLTITLPDLEKNACIPY